MRFTTFVPTLMAVLALCGHVYALPNPAPAPATALTATNAPDASNKLIEFNLLWWYVPLGLVEYDATGAYDTCYNTPGLWSWLTGSIKLIPPTNSCWVFQGAGCTGTSFQVLPGGVSIWDGKSQSYQCDNPAGTGNGTGK